MTLSDIEGRGLVLLGCGKMGSALLQGWLAGGLDAGDVWIVDPYPSDWLQGLAQTGLHLNEGLPEAPRACVIAVKPQMMGDALPQLQAVKGAVFVSIAAGTPISAFEAAFGSDAAIVRAMPNTPAAVAQGITALIGNANASEQDLGLAQDLMSSVGRTVWLESEDQMDAVTGVSGSGPAYVFHMIEALTAAAEAQGLSPDLSLDLARSTVAGAGALAMQSDDSPAQLRINVTSPAGTTEAGLKVLMDPQSGLPPLIETTVAAAANRSRELAK